MKQLYFGNNLAVLRDSIASESVDLIYLDPPFNSQADYNVTFRDQTGQHSGAQIHAFHDTWQWGTESEQALEDLMTTHGQLAKFLLDLVGFLGRNSLSAYLVMMAVRLVELHRVLKSTGSLYLHCDPTASHYLKILLDIIFEPKNFKNEIIWRRTGSHGNPKKFGPIHDVILFYTKSKDYVWAYPTEPYMRGHVENNFKRDELGWRTNYSGNVLTGSGTRNGESGMEWRGFHPTSKGRHWAIPGKLLEDLPETISQLGTLDKLEKLYELDLIKIVEGAVWPIYERRIKPQDGTKTGDIWSYQPYTEGTVFGTELGIDDDVRWLGTKDSERLGYPTQKPVGLLRRILEASSRPGDVVLDPFCGCGTTISAAQQLDRQWIGIDITHLSVSLIKARLKRDFDLVVGKDYQEIGTPRDVAGAQYFAETNPFQFQFWIVGEIGAQPYGAVGDSKQGKKGGDTGIDGQLYFRTPDGGKIERVIVSVKAGKHLNPAMVRDLHGTVEREKAAIGILLLAHSPTKGMLQEAAKAGAYTWGGRIFPKLQILTVEQLLAGEQPLLPRGVVNVSYEQKEVKSLTGKGSKDKGAAPLFGN